MRPSQVIRAMMRTGPLPSGKLLFIRVPPLHQDHLSRSSGADHHAPVVWIRQALGASSYHTLLYYKTELFGEIYCSALYSFLFYTLTF